MDKTHLRLLLVEDSEDDANLILRELARNGYETEVLRVDTAPSFQTALATASWDLILADFSLPNFNGLEALRLYNESELDLPFILVSGTVGEEVAVGAMTAGAHDYLLKDNLTRLGPAVARELREYRVRHGRQEDHLRIAASERRFTTIFQNSPVAILISGLNDGRILDINPTGLNLIGYQRDELIGHFTTEFGSWADLEQRNRTIAATLAAGPGRSIECSIHTKHRGTIPTLASFSLIELDGSARLLVTLQDITERKAVEKTLVESEERYRLLVENSHDLVAEIDPTGRMLYVSPNHQTITGHSLPELLAANLKDFIQTEFGHLAPAECATERGFVNVRCRFRHRDGHWLSLESSGRPFTTSAGEKRIVVISRDITDTLRVEEARKTLETQLRQAQKMEAIGTLAGGIAHDFNNILTAILGYVQLSRLELPNDHPAQTFLSGAQHGSERAKDLVSQILTFSRRREQQRTVTSLEPIISDALRLLRASLPSTIEICTELNEPCPPVLCDVTQLHQIIMNLGTNAAHAMSEKGGVITLTLNQTQPDSAIVASHPQLKHKHTVCLTVSDTGSGMDAATRERIFEPFFTTKAVGEGTGLGLSVAHGIVQSHEGAIVCDSRLNEGTHFRLFFPTVEPQEASPPPLPTEVPHGQGERILIIDDEDAVVSIARQMMQRIGYDVAAFTHPITALEAFDRDPDSFDLVVSDLTMPGMTGTEVAQHIMTRRPALPIVIATGFMKTHDIDSARISGVRFFLEKPFSLVGLANCLHEALSTLPRIGTDTGR